MSSAAGSWAPGSPRWPPGPGFDVLVREVDDAAAAEPREQRINVLAGQGRAAGKATRGRARGDAGPADFTSDLTDFADRDVVIEAVVEDEHEKVAIFAALGKIVAAGLPAGQQHLVDPDHEAGRGDRCTRSG